MRADDGGVQAEVCAVTTLWQLRQEVCLTCTECASLVQVTDRDQIRWYKCNLSNEATSLLRKACSLAKVRNYAITPMLRERFVQ